MNENNKVTIDHEKIKRWAKEHGGKPEVIDNPEGGKNIVGLRINFAGKNDDVFLPESDFTLDVTWDKFFQEFDNQNLAFEYDDREIIDDPSDAYRFIKRQNIEDVR